VVGLLAGGLVVALAQNYGDDPPAPPAAAAAATAVGASIGVYTTEQADRGAGVFAARCSGCHGGALEGGFGPRLAPLGAHWRGQTLGSLFRFVSSNMPYDNPGSLEMDQYLDVVSFVLSSNGYPAGESPLVADAAVIDPVLIDDPPPAP
jgi:mono/diheme cytochrome c family protein